MIVFLVRSWYNPRPPIAWKMSYSGLQRCDYILVMEKTHAKSLTVSEVSFPFVSSKPNMFG